MREKGLTEHEAHPLFTIRLAAVADAEALAALHLHAWQWAYRGQLPDAYLDALPVTRARWFYAAGWAPGGAAKTEERPGVVLLEVRYRVTLLRRAPIPSL